jgi:putative sugar O-methyltransferase
LVPEELVYDWQKSRKATPHALPLSRSGGDSLTPDHPRLRELRQAYASFGGPVTRAAIWTDDFVKPEHLQYFRGENGYVWQIRDRNQNELGYSLSYHYSRSSDRLKLLDRLEEDGAFGAHVFDVGRAISRDLLDSVLELNFLDRHLRIGGKETAMLDIGAGYGRLAHRTLVGLDSVRRYICTDAIAASTFLCEYYVRYRQLDDRVRVVPLHEIEHTLETERVDLAVNIHSWSECSVEAIDWWVALLRRRGVPHVMVVPNQVSPDETRMRTNLAEDFSVVLESHGYALTARERKYTDPLAHKYAVSPAIYFLWSLRPD